MVGSRFKCLNCGRPFEQEYSLQFCCDVECQREWNRKNRVFSEKQEQEIRRIVKEELENKNDR